MKVPVALTDLQGNVIVVNMANVETLAQIPARAADPTVPSSVATPSHTYITCHDGGGSTSYYHVLENPISIVNMLRVTKPIKY